MSEYRIHAIRYATNDDRRASDNFMDGDPHDGPMSMDFYIWVIQSDSRTVVVDTGFDEQSALRRQRTVRRPVCEGLKAIGVDPMQVDHVILTHLHYDHCGNHDLFPAARYHVQEKELSFCTGPCMCHAQYRNPYDVEDVSAVVRKLFEGRVEVHNGVSQLAPGISVHWIGGHSQGLQVVRVKTSRGWVVLASDAAHYYENFEQMRPFPAVTDLREMLDGYSTIERLATSRAHVIPGHDPLVLKKYASAEKGSGIVRLDVAPIL